MQGRVRDISRRTEEKYEYASEAEFLASTVVDGLHAINVGGLPLDILYRHRSAETTIVTFHAAATTQASIPIFSGTRMTEGINANVIFVSDPSLNLDEKIKLGWFAGNKRQPLQSVLPEIISHIMSSTGSKHLIFFGASGGGFASLYYSSLFPGSLAIGVNPRTIVAKSFPAAISRYAHICWGLSEKQDLSNLLATTIHSDLRVHTPQPPKNTVAYVQNVQDDRYIETSLLPYLDAFEDTSNIHLLMKDWGKGHVPADRPFLIELLDRATAHAPDWHHALEGLRFFHAPTADRVADIRKELRTRPNQSGVIARDRMSRIISSNERSDSRLWPLDAVQPLNGAPVTCVDSNSAQKVQWDEPLGRRLYLKTFDGDFGSPPSGTGSEVTNTLPDSLIRVQFDTAGAEPHPVEITLFALQYTGSERRITDTWKFEVGLQETAHTALIPVLTATDSVRFAFLVHSKDAGSFRLLRLETSHY